MFILILFCLTSLRNKDVFLILPTCTCFSHEFRLFIRIRGIPFTTKSMLRENFLKEVKGFIELEKEEFFKDHAEKVFS